MDQDKYDYVIYHKGCLDGFTGFIILTMTNTIKHDALIYPDQPYSKELPPNIKNKNIIIIDVAYKKEILEQIFAVAKKVTFIDHHDSISEDVKTLDTKSIHEIIYNDKKSGASLTWEYFNKDKKIPNFIKYIEDNDTGAWKLKYTIPFINGLKVKYNLQQTEINITKWTKLFNKVEVKSLIKKGLIYAEYQNFLLHENMKKYSMELFPSKKIYDLFPDKFKKPGQYRVVVYNGSGCPTASLLGREFVKKMHCDFCIMWVLNLDRNEYVLQFRSRTINDGLVTEIIDVGQIAKIFDGGGHVHASACSFPATKYNMKELFYPESLSRY
jgi:hypothetical protein